MADWTFSTKSLTTNYITRAFRTSQIGETTKDILSQHRSTAPLVPYQISQDTHLWHEAFNSNVNMIQRKVCLFRRSHRPCLKRNHSVYLTSFSLIYAILIFHFSVTQDAFDTVCNIRDSFFCETHVTIKKLEIFVKGRAHEA